MSLPQIAGLELLELIGRGSCGSVYRAVKLDSGEACAVKVFGSMSVSRKLLSIAMRGLQQMPEHPGLPRPLAFDFDNSPYYCAMPLVGFSTEDEEGNTHWDTPTLEDCCGKSGPDEAWRYIYELCDSMAWLHRHNLVHCNLKPRNILLGDDPNSATKIVDVVQGWIGGTQQFEATDHLMYMPPGQVEHPEALARHGTSWDVYSFGVIAYKLITGQFPRGAEAYADQAARQMLPAGRSPTLDNAVMLQSVRAQHDVTWPTTPATKWDARRKRIIEKCLELEAEDRWPDLREVMHEYEKLEAEYLLEDSNEKLELEKRKQTRKVSLLRALSLVLVAAIIIEGIWGLIYVNNLRHRANQAEGLLAQRDAAISEKDHALQLLGQENSSKSIDLSTRLKEEREEKLLANQNLQMSQAAVDQFLTQLLQMPTGVGLEAEISEKQIKDALTFYENERKRLKDNDELLPERARNYFNTAQLLLRKQQRPEAADYLEKAKSAIQVLLQKQPGHADLARRQDLLGRACRWLGTLKAEIGRRGEALELFQQAVAALGIAAQSDPKSRPMRYECASAWYELGKRSRRDGKITEASDALGKVAEMMDTKVIGEELTAQEQFLLSRSRIEQALTQRDVGNPDKAMKTLFDAMEEMVKLVERSSHNPEQAITLAEAYIEFGEIVASKLGGNDAKEAHTEAMNILIELVRVHPQWGEARYLLGRNHGDLAALDRDLGNPTEALRRQNMAVQAMADLVKLYPDNTRYVTELAKLKSQNAQMLCDLGKAKDSVPMAEEALAPLEALLQKDEAALDKMDRKACAILLAQIYGILGHSGESMKNPVLAKASFTKAYEQWEKLKAQHDNDEVIQQGLAWTKDRLSKLR
ncbi:MAG: tetratricopeptide repeat-containing protein kinase family protein [Verrucomicrobiaceae bacterium]